MDIARKTAFDVLVSYEKSRVYPNLALKSKLRDVSSEQDKRFVSAVVYGVIEKKLLLDYYIASVSTVKIKKIAPPVLTAIRMGLYQLIFLSTPQSAACNTSVELVKTNGYIKSAGFTNAVLRRLAREGDTIRLPQAPLERMRITHSVSPEVLQVLVDSLGTEETEAFLNYKPDTTNVTVAVNPLRCTVAQLQASLQAQGIASALTDCEGLLSIPGCDIASLRAYRDGWFHVISKPSYIAARLIAQYPAQVIYDMCAAPGGKTFVIAANQPKASITAFDIHNHKIDGIMSTCDRLGICNVKAVVANSALQNTDLMETADAVLCDVPCSGLGMIHQKPDIKYKPVDSGSLAQLQYAVLKNASDYLKPGGRLVYSTCTVNRLENQNVVSKLLESMPEMQIDKNAEIYDNMYGEKTFLPHADHMDGFYIAVLRKTR